MCGTRVIKVETTNSNPSLEGGRLEPGEFFVSLRITIIGRYDREAGRMDLGECEIQVSEAFRVNLAGGNSIAKSVARVGCLVIANGTATC